MQEPILLIDVGNTMTALAVAGSAGNGKVRSVMRLPTAEFSARNAAAAVTRIGKGLKFAGAMGASVVPAVNQLWQVEVERVGGVCLRWVRHDQPWNFHWRYPHPETLGADRIVNLCAACRRYRPPLVVLDFGTALTVDSINSDAEFVGGMIAPGFAMLCDGLTQRTALLPSMSLRIGRMPARADGRNTRAAMRNGLLLGYRGLVRELIHAALAPLARDVTICATGGYAKQMMAALPDIPCRVHPQLTLEGLAAAYALAAQD